MGYQSMQEAIEALRNSKQLVEIKEEVDPDLEMAAIHRQVNAMGGPAILFTRIKDSPFPAVSNLFGTIERARFLFRDELADVGKILKLRQDPGQVFKSPWKHLGLLRKSRAAFPKKKNFQGFKYANCRLEDLPAIKSWPLDGGRFITLPLVYSEDPMQAGVMGSNLGMYRIQVSGNEYSNGKEVGLHYQIHRGIGVHHTHAKQLGKKLPVTIFVGGSPANTLAAVMPLPEGISELQFAGLLNGKRFGYAYQDGHFIPEDADFIITGTIDPNAVKPEGPFGDHLGYYSLKHSFPVLQVDAVYCKKDPVWPFTVVGRPPQEDSVFGKLIHEISGGLIAKEIPGVKEVNAVDEAGVHPLLLAVGKERYTPYLSEDRPSELLTIANRILGSGQLSLAKYLFIATDSAGTPSVNEKEKFLIHLMERFDQVRDLHFQTETHIDTLDYSGVGINRGSKLIVACGTQKKRELSHVLPDSFPAGKLIIPGLVVVPFSPWKNQEHAESEIRTWANTLGAQHGIAMIILVDSLEEFMCNPFNDLLWITFTRSNPSHDVHGVGEFTRHKHWGCDGPLIIDARKKSHHAPVLETDPAVEKKAAALLHKLGLRGA